MNPPKRARWYFLHCWRVHFASWKCLHKHIKYTSLIVDVNYSWPDTPILPDPGHSDQHGNSNHTRQYLRVATLTNLANLPTPVNLAISAKPAILALLSTMATLANPGYFFFCSWNSWTGETRPKGKGQFQEEHSIQFSKPSHAKPYITCLFALEQPPWLTLTPWHIKIKPIWLCIFAKSWIGETWLNSKGQFQEEHLVPFSKPGHTKP